MRVKKLNFMSFLCSIKFACFLSLISYVQCSGVQCRTKVTFIYKNYTGHAYSAENLPKILENENFDQQKITTIYSYGFTQTPFVSSVRAVVDAYLQNGNYNFMVISCDSIIAYSVFTANQIADDIADSLVKMYESGYSKFHLVGFSLGGQIVGLIGQKVKKNSNEKYTIPRITGLDPGQVLPFLGVSISLLSPSDADFVDVIHAESNYFGSAESTGHANFWVNGGKSQPMCKNKIYILTAVCSHLMTTTYWAESISSENQSVFKAQKCENYHDFVNKKCEESATTPMGLSVDLQSRGNFYLQTNLDSPYSKD